MSNEKKEKELRIQAEKTLSAREVSWGAALIAKDDKMWESIHRAEKAEKLAKTNYSSLEAAESHLAEARDRIAELEKQAGLMVESAKICNLALELSENTVRARDMREMKDRVEKAEARLKDFADKVGYSCIVHDYETCPTCVRDLRKEEKKGQSLTQDLAAATRKQKELRKAFEHPHYPGKCRRFNSAQQNSCPNFCADCRALNLDND